MKDDFTKIKRYELKYLISEDTAQAIRDYISSFCRLDKHADPSSSGYTVNNIYFDTPDLRFYHDTRFKKMTRFKPRARYYGDRPSDYIFPELKYRNSSVIWKTRYKLKVEDWLDHFSIKQSPAEEPRMKDSYDTFDEVIQLYNAQPILHVRYFREPYVTELEEYGRVTFDRNLTSRLANGSYNLELDEDYLYYDDPQTIRSDVSRVLLEIKVETNVPHWVIYIIQNFNLIQTGFSKYCNGIDYHLGYMTHVPRWL